MKKLFLLFFCLFSFILIHAQTIKSEPLGVWKNNKQVIFKNDDGEQVIKMPTQFTYNRQLKKPTKVVRIDGESYHIIREKKEHQVFKKGGELVATINKKDKSIYLVERNQRFNKGYNWYKSASYYTNEIGEKVSIADFVKYRVYKLSTKQGAFENNKLLMVLNLHQFLEHQREMEGITDLMLLTTTF